MAKTSKLKIACAELKQTAIAVAKGEAPREAFEAKYQKIVKDHGRFLYDLSNAYEGLAEGIRLKKKAPTKPLPPELFFFTPIIESLERDNLLARFDERSSVMKEGGHSAMRYMSLPWRRENIFNRLTAFGATMCREVGAQLDEKLLEGFLKGQYGADTLISAYAWGATRDMIDPEISDRNLVEMKELGSGVANTTYLCTYRRADGSTFQRVFKPEFTGRAGLEDLSIGGNGTYQPFQQIAQLNKAASEVANLLGTEGTVVGSTVGSLKGRFGIFMEVAPGSAPAGFGSVLVETDSFNSIKLGEMTVEELKDLSLRDPQRYALFFGNLMHALNDLEWNDLISGQEDRHYGNYTVFVGKDLSVKITGIDNDAAFTTFRTGISTFKCESWRVDKFKAALRMNSRPWPIKEEDLATKPAGTPTGIKGVTFGGNGSLIINTEENPGLCGYLRPTFGLQKAYIPTAISESTYNHLKAMVEDLPNVLAKFRARGLGDAQLEAMESRIKDAWRHAKILAKKRCVIRPQGPSLDNPNVTLPDRWAYKNFRDALLMKMFAISGCYDVIKTDKGFDLHWRETRMGGNAVARTEFLVSDFYNLGEMLPLPTCDGAVV